MKKFILSILSLILALPLLFSFAACEEEAETSSLIGSFTYSDAIKTNEADGDLRIYGNESEATDGNMFVTKYPFNTITSAKVCYTVDQRLRLKRDFTYNYQYTITLTNGEEWGKDCAQIAVQISGTFTYASIDGDYYEVTLNDPTEGTQTVYGSTVGIEGSIYAWNLNTAESYVIDVAHELSLNADYEYNRYLKGRVLTVVKSDKEVYDDIYFRDIMNDIAPYSDYVF